MSLPSTVFLDTSVLAGQQYNFSSTALTSFVPIAKKRGLKLLLPDPTSREVARQIRQRSDEALKALEEARRKAPFLSKWKHWPQKPAGQLHEWEVRRIAQQEWQAFLKQFDLVKLGYDGVKIETVMSWYDAPRAPFREGKKRKEFPDAFAIATLAAYASQNNCYIAVVSEDPDFKAACEFFASLLYFPTLPRLTELLLLEDSQIDGLREGIVSGVAAIEEALYEKGANLIFYHYNSECEISETEIRSVSISDIRVVGLGDGECTVTFDAELDCRHRLVWKEWDHPDEGEYIVRHDYISETAEVSGTAKVQLNPATKTITAIPFLELDQFDIEVTDTPYFNHDY